MFKSVVNHKKLRLDMIKRDIMNSEVELKQLEDARASGTLPFRLAEYAESVSESLREEIEYTKSILKTEKSIIKAFSKGEGTSVYVHMDDGSIYEGELYSCNTYDLLMEYNQEIYDLFIPNIKEIEIKEGK